MSISFAFQHAESANELMTELEKFIVFWLGPRLPEYGEPVSALDRAPIPYPLHSLYAFAGRWPPTEPRRKDQPHAFCVQDCLIPYSRLRPPDDGKVIFLLENQSCWTCATLWEGHDPPVWAAGDLNFPTRDDGKWHLICNSLSRFLVSFCLQELLFGSLVGTDSNDAERYLSWEHEDLTPLWIDGPFVTSGTIWDFYLLKQDILVGRYNDGTLIYGLRPATNPRL